MKVSDFIARVIANAGLTDVFGIPPYTNIDLLNALTEEKFHVMLNSHEQNAVLAAEGYYYATDKIPVISIATGVGMTNALSALSNAYVEGIPMLVLTATPSAKWIGRNEYHASSGYGYTVNE